MNRVMRGTVLLAAALAVLSCQGDPTGNLRNGIDHLLASPGAIFLGQDSSKFVVVTAVDEQGNSLGTNFTLGAVGAGITVVPDDSFNLVRNTQGNLVPPKNWTAARFIVTGVANDGSSSFVVTAGGKSVTIPVRIAPDSATLTLSSAAPALGDTVTATASANFRFTPASAVSVAGASVLTLGISADSTQITFIPGPNGNGPVLVSGMLATYSPALTGLTGTTGPVFLTTTLVTNIPAVFSNATPNTNDVLSVTATGFKFLPTTAVTFGGQYQTVDSVAADSNTVYLRVTQAGAAAPVSFTNVVLAALTIVPLVDLPSVNTIAVGATVNSLAGTNSIATAPALSLPLSGGTAQLNDLGTTFAAADCGAVGNHCRFYKLVVTADGTFDFNISWGNTADFGGYFLDATGSDIFGDFACDAHGSGATAHPETCTEDLAAGTYYLALADFTAGAQNTSYVVNITAQ